MARYIDADELSFTMYIEAMTKDSDMQKWDSGCWIRYKLFEIVLAKIPTANVAPAIHAKWNIDDKGDFRCSHCKAIVEPDVWYWNRFLYCYHCGAKMEENNES